MGGQDVGDRGEGSLVIIPSVLKLGDGYGGLV